MTVDRVHQLLGAPELARLVDALVRRVELARPITGRLVLRVKPDERAAIAALFGQRTGVGTTMSVDLDRLERVVRSAGVADSLAAAIEALRGPLVVRSEQEEALQRAWNHAHLFFDRLLASRPELDEWVSRVRARGTVRRLAVSPEEGERLVERVVRLLEALPAAGEGLPRLASRLLGSAHALDQGSPEAALVLSALRALPGAPAVEPGARGRRELWASAGVAIDELSSTVLVHRLALPGVVGELTRAGEPVVLTLRQLSALEIPVPDTPVFVCENPSVVDAAVRELAGVGPPLVCTQGQPSLAANVLLDRIQGAGLLYHGDFDWGGLRIANRIFDRFGFEPWRFRTDDLEVARDLPGAPLKGVPVEAKWDPLLMPALSARASRLEEEQVLDVLLEDLAAT
ncbi:TIGR02679 family protein [Leucobacter sp. wl10]|uniref:TIGR02679 family protein n=1 Tax=Leucobacter sp. wl10 TaxID=2304677 RepID=UPI000E5B46E2|nr:TIGR02679 family protein [Leucobacter sp. wl10]RGE19251.1 TIGR02679 family protein [Leucobacter sp. wl10]